jgi:hypothetical protein
MLILAADTLTLEIRMDAISSATTANAIQAVNDVLKNATKEAIDAAVKNIKVVTEMKVGDNTVDGYA